jgi:hypothetical protein
MKDLEKDKIELRKKFKRAIKVGIIIIILVFCLLLSGILEVPMMLILTMILFATTWVILYIDYCLLKLKIEIMEELSKEKETNP